MQPQVGTTPPLPPLSGPAPEHFFDGQLQSEGYLLFRSANLSLPLVLDRRMALNQESVLIDDANHGRVTGDVQNLRVIVSRGWLRAATLQPDYGLVMDTYPSVMANIARGAPGGG